MVNFSQPNGLDCHPVLGKLHSVQEEIFRQLQLLIPDDYAFEDRLESRVAGSPLLKLEILERHPYTTFMHLTYEFSDEDSTTQSPNAYIRSYQDARIAEATSYDSDQGCTRMAHPAYPSIQLMQRAWRLNRALDRWLDYLIRQGHSVVTMQPCEEALKV